MSVLDHPPRRTRGGGAGDVVLVVVLIAAALAVVLTIVFVAAGGERARGGPRGPGALDAVGATATAAGLTVCESTDLPDPRATNAVASRTLVVAQDCAAAGAAPAAVGDRRAEVQVDRFADTAARDAAARSIEGQVRPRGSATVLTTGELTVVVRGTSDDTTAQRLVDALRAAGAR
ncbi:hypothetical protein GCM10023200_42800 [Actinomycetospora chlora]|uniref:Uncharacterized protein n=1 Tax=Actinomycetospora chlora TaxID=663608 RepID=A0ABP9C0V6_9PSEU